MCDLLGASSEFPAKLIRRIDGEVKLKLFRQGVTPDYIKRIREWKSNNINSSNIKDNKKENIDNKKENVISTSKFDPFGTDSDSY